jgi:hypothetical protein
MLLFVLTAYTGVVPRSGEVAVVSALVLPWLVLLRRPLGFLIQRRRLLSLSFEEARILRIKKVHAELLFERPPVYLVETMVRT